MMSLFFITDLTQKQHLPLALRPRPEASSLDFQFDLFGYGVSGVRESFMTELLLFPISHGGSGGQISSGLALGSIWIQDSSWQNNVVLQPSSLGEI